MKQHKTPTIALRLFIFFCVVALSVLAIFLWWNDGVTAVNQTDTTPQSFSINTGETPSEIASRLSAERLIRSKTVFYLYIKFNGIDSKIQAGDFTLTRSMSLPEVAHQLTIGTMDVKVTTLEGWRDEEIAAKLSETIGISEEDFLANAKEGYMFPDTYELPKNSSAAAVAALFRKTFDDRVTQTMRDAIIKQGRTLNDVVTLASLLEREGRSDTDRPMIAGILLKRIAAGMPLQVDATLQFALGYQANEHTWWKKDLTDADKEINSPYNTYKNPGLPPGPIANPGLSSLNAAIYPTDSPYLYYLHDPQGQVHYAKTLEEHNANVAKYLQ